MLIKTSLKSVLEKEEKNGGDKKNIAHMVTIDSEQGVAISGF